RHEVAALGPPRFRCYKAAAPGGMRVLCFGRSDRRVLGRAAPAAALVLALAASGCSSTDFFGPSRSAAPAPANPPPAGSTTFTDRMNAFVFGPPARPGDPAAEPPPNADQDCPGVDVRTGAATLSIGAPGTEPGPTSVRYQVSIAQMARECTVRGPTMAMKIGV